MPDSAIDTIVHSLAPSTLKQYGTTYRRWWEYCAREDICPYEGSVSHVISFLQGLLDSTTNLYGSFNAHRSALALIVSNDITNSPHIKRFLKGVFRMRPSLPRYENTWDPQKVLEFFQNRPSDDLKDLTCKLATLLALATGQRIQTLSLIKRANIQILDTGLKIFIPDLVKTSAPTRNQPCLYLPTYAENPNLCVATLVKNYLARTVDLKPGNCDHLFLTYGKPHKPASKQTISRWVKLSLRKAGIDVSTFGVHSTRHAATSAAFRIGVSWDVIRKAAGWSQNSSSFARFYNRPIGEESGFFNSIFRKHSI